MATFYIEALENTTIKLIKHDGIYSSHTPGAAKYGVNDTSVPNNYTYGTDISLTTNQKCYFTIESVSATWDNDEYIYFTSTNKITVGGELKDLNGGSDTLNRDRYFYKLFYACEKLIDAGALVLIENLSNGCYDSMFTNCNNLVVAPKLLATKLKPACYRQMFFNCASLLNAPELPAMELASDCYSLMFFGCASLVKAPKLPALELDDNCYLNMFENCTSLMLPPVLPAMTLSPLCYSAMFANCTSLRTLPLLPATELAEECYEEMFIGCTSLKLSTTQTDQYQLKYRIPSSGIGTDADYALEYMFDETGGSFIGTPDINTTYYIDTRSYIGTLQDTNQDIIYPRTRKSAILDAINEVPIDGNINQILTKTNSGYAWADAISNLKVVDKEIAMPDKGQLVMIDIDGNGEKEYRVLAINGARAKVVAMYPFAVRQFDVHQRSISCGDYEIPKYNESDIDNYLNNTFYNGLLPEIKNAIIPQNITQHGYIYYDEPNERGGAPQRTYQFEYNWSQDDTDKYDNLEAIGEVPVGDRYIYLLDVADIFEYHGSRIIESNDLNQLFFKQDTSVSANSELWLRSGVADFTDLAGYTVHGQYGCIQYLTYASNTTFRPAFVIDLDNISWS